MSLPTIPIDPPITIDERRAQAVEVRRIDDPGDGGPSVSIRVVWEDPDDAGRMSREYREVERSLIVAKWDDPADERTFKAWIFAIINSTV